MTRNAALWYARRGYLVFPVDGKLPKYAKGTHVQWAPGRDRPAGLSCATGDLNVIDMHWPGRAGIGVVPPPGVAFIDCDEKHRAGVVEWALQRWPTLDAGGHHLTPSKGAHFPVRVPAHVNLKQSVDPNLGIDVRTALKGYVVAPPSPGYVAVRPFLRAEDLPLIPLDLVDLLSPPPPPRTGPPPRPPSPERLSAFVWAALKGKHTNVASVPNESGSCNRTLYHASIKLGTLIGAGVLAREDAEDALLDACRINGMPRNEAERTIASGINYGIQHPRQLESRAS